MFQLDDLTAQAIENEHINKEPPKPRNLFDPRDNTDADSDASERCFKEMYAGDSRKWLIRDATGKYPREPPSSTMKDTYLWPFLDIEARPKLGRRMHHLQKSLIEEVATAMTQKNIEPPPVEKYCSTYDLTHQIPGFAPKTNTYSDTELYEKYPLYSSNSMSYWQFLYENRNGMPGYTGIADVKQPFKKRSLISKPLNEVLDDVPI